MKSKFKFKWSYIVYIASLAAAIFLTSVITDNIKLKNYLKNDMHFEAWDLVYNNPVSFVLSSSAKDDGIKFFDVMATHQSDESNSISGDWDLPDFTGWSCAEVACALKNIGQPYEVRFMEAPQMQHNVVVQQEPAFGGSVSKDDTVVLYANSAYGTEAIAYYIPVYKGNINECGEWLIFEQNGYIYKCHTDFSDIEEIYECEDKYISGNISIVSVENSIFFIDEEGDDIYTYCLLSIDLKTNDVKRINENMDFTIISQYYDNTLYFSRGMDGIGKINLDTNEFTITDSKIRSVIYNNTIYSFEVEEIEDDIYISSVYTQDYNNCDSEPQLLQKIDGHIGYILPYKDFIIIAYSANDQEVIVYKYNLSDGTWDILMSNSYSEVRVASFVSAFIFNEKIYLLNLHNYDCFYDINTMKRTPITIITGESVYYNFLGGERLRGNYFANFNAGFLGKYTYNMLTGEVESVTEADELNEYLK